MQRRMAEPAYEVVAPTGLPSDVVRRALAPRLPNLDGATVALVWDHVFKGPEIFRAFAEVVGLQATGMRFIDHEPFGNIHGTAEEEHDAVAHLAERLREYRVDAALVGVGA